MYNNPRWYGKKVRANHYMVLYLLYILTWHIQGAQHFTILPGIMSQDEAESAPPSAGIRVLYPSTLYTCMHTTCAHSIHSLLLHAEAPVARKKKGTMSHGRKILLGLVRRVPVQVTISNHIMHMQLCEHCQLVEEEGIKKGTSFEKLKTTERGRKKIRGLLRSIGGR